MFINTIIISVHFIFLETVYIIQILYNSMRTKEATFRDVC